MISTERREAAVVLGFHRDAGGELTVVLIERTRRGRHGGQLSFPGGRIEPSDPDPQAAAVRETCEEIGATPDQVRILDALDPAETATSGYRVWPFVARLDVPPGHRWTPQESEAVAVLELLVARLAADEARGEAAFEFPGWEGPRVVPTRSVDGHVVWGLTLRLLEPRLPEVLCGRWPV